ncbi:MAG: class I poly(R)-hydroxyalkanoic acid synthase, partial [Alphaproteobacteria bacterium]|nr:class I poly(R)-hydroxyalkanoic acid synthase [Alphaproteobacteria bacterium]
MSDQQNEKGTGREIPEAEDLTAAMAKIAERSQVLVNGFLANQSGSSIGMGDPLNIGQAFLELTQRMMSNPAHLMQAQFELWQGYMNLWQNTAQRMMGAEVENVAEPAADDRRFRDSEWDESILFDYIKQSYLLSSQWLTNTVRDVEGLDDKTAKKVDFYTRQFVDALAPTNFLMTNPELIRATVESKGENLV